MVSSFVEKKLHDYNPLVPSLMMNGNWVVISLYDCVNDYLPITTCMMRLGFSMDLFLVIHQSQVLINSLITGTTDTLLEPK